MSFIEGTFQAIEGNGTQSLVFEGGYRYVFEMDFQTANNLSALGIWRIYIQKYYGSAQSIGVSCNTRASSTFTFEQTNQSVVVVDASSDIIFDFSFPNTSYASQRLSTSASLTVWRFPL